ncbi:MAG: response regulator transcription factor [Clostridia bacterium]|nr:response regulator transcription factor [Clostridia bacterium]
MKNILVLEDEATIREFIVINLQRAGYEIVEASTGEEALSIIDSTPTGFSLYLLDINLPGIDGFAVCRRIRERTSDSGIIMLSARSQEIDRVSGLMLGADDYITKPFSPSELVARVDALYRRVSGKFEHLERAREEFKCGRFRLIGLTRTLVKDDEPIELTQVEYLMLKLFFENPDVAISRESISDAVWGDGYHNDLKVVDVNIRRLRMKVEEDPSYPRTIIKVWGYGYKWVSKS